MFLNRQADIESVLILTQIAGVPITVRIPGVEKTYSSSFVEIGSEPDNKPSLLIARLAPAGGNNLLPYSKSLNVTFTLSSGGRRPDQAGYSFNAFFIRNETFENTPVVRITFPELRRYHRAEPGPGELITISSSLSGDAAPQPLANISEGGIGFYTESDSALLRQGGAFTVTFTLPDGSSITAPVVARWISRLQPGKTIQGRRYGFFCGVEFQKLEQQMRRSIAEYVEKRKQEELKKLIADESLWADFT